MTNRCSEGVGTLFQLESLIEKLLKLLLLMILVFAALTSHKYVECRSHCSMGTPGHQAFSSSPNSVCPTPKLSAIPAGNFGLRSF